MPQGIDILLIYPGKKEEQPSEELLGIKRRFDRKNIVNYLKINLCHRNFRLIFEKIIAGRTEYI
jgi:hypothetical protein